MQTPVGSEIAAINPPNEIKHFLAQSNRASPKKGVWRVLIERMELRRILSVKRAAELDKQLETGEGLPDIEEKQILAMPEGTFNQLPAFIEEAVKEVFEILRPRNSKLKTNSEFEIGKRVIKNYFVERCYDGKKYRISYDYEKEARAIDNVFHALDGKGTVKSYSGPLIDAITASPDGKGETDYFKFKCHKNRRLHLEFKRPDLVQKLNAIAGGMRLKDFAKTNQPKPQASTEPELLLANS